MKAPEATCERIGSCAVRRVYSSEPEAARAFLRETLKLPYSDVGEGWLIFDLPEGDLGIHPVDPGQSGGGHDVSFYCDDLPGTVAELKSRGVEFDGEIADHGYGLVTYFRIPGGLRIQLYEPRYQKRSAQAPRTAKKAVKKAAKTAKTAVKKIAAKARRVVGKAQPKAKAKPAAKRGSTAKRGR